MYVIILYAFSNNMSYTPKIILFLVMCYLKSNKNILCRGKRLLKLQSAFILYQHFMFYKRLNELMHWRMAHQSSINSATNETGAKCCLPLRPCCSAHLPQMTLWDTCSWYKSLIWWIPKYPALVKTLRLECSVRTPAVNPWRPLLASLKPC